LKDAAEAVGKCRQRLLDQGSAFVERRPEIRIAEAAIEFVELRRCSMNASAPPWQCGFKLLRIHYQCTLQNGQRAGAASSASSSASSFIRVSEAPVISMEVAYLPTSGATALIPRCAKAAATRRYMMYSSSAGVAPKLLTSTAARSPRAKSSSGSKCSSISSVKASAFFNGPRQMPGSPWMPMPNSTSVSPIANDGLPDSGTTQGVNATPIERQASLAFCATPATASSEAPAAALAPAAL